MLRLSFTSRFRSVRGRLFLLIAALVVPSVIIIAGLTWRAFLSQRTAVRAEVLNTARAVASLVDAEVDRAAVQVETLLAARSLRELDWETLDETARRIFPTEGQWLVVVDSEGEQQINTRLPRGADLPRLELAEDYRAAMLSGEQFVSNLVYGPVADGLVVHVGRTFVHPSGKRFGVNVVISPEAFGRALDVRRYAPDGVVAVLDREGRIITRNPSQPGFVGGSATPDTVAATRARAEGTGESVTLEGIPVYTGFSRAECGWSVIIGSPKSKVQAGTRELILLALAATVLVTLGAVLLALWIARAVVRSVDGLAQDADRLARGEAPVHASDLLEIEQVAAAMRQLAATREQAEGELRQARDDLQRYAVELEQRVQTRTASLRDAVAQMEEFSYTVSHDLRAPLRAMSGYAQILLDEHGASLDERARGFLQRILRASERMTRLTTDILSYSRIARADLPRATVELERVLENILEHYAELAPANADVTVVKPLHPVLAHETALTQAIANLLTNAAKFVPTGRRPKIRVWTERRDTRVRLWVEDNGIGIPHSQQGRLFRIFERMPEAGGYEGTGVGLAIVRKVMDKSGGTCGVESDGAYGSRFWIELPAAAADVALTPVLQEA